MNVFDEEGYLRKMNIKSDNLIYKFQDSGLSVEGMAQNLFNNLSDKWGFKHISTDGMYDPSRNTFWEDVKTYAVLYAFDLYSSIQETMRDFAAEVYPIYESGDYELFNSRCFEATRLLNQGKMTKKQKIKAASIKKSLDILASLDEDYCHYLVDKHLAKDEFTELDDHTRVLTC